MEESFLHILYMHIIYYFPDLWVGFIHLINTNYLWGLMGVFSAHVQLELLFLSLDR